MVINTSTLVSRSSIFALLVAIAPLQACSQAQQSEVPGGLNDSTYDVTPPEFVPCDDLVNTLARADAMLRKLGQYSQTREAAYWVKRQERLIARAYECRG